VIVNTIDRAAALHTLLRSLEHQSYPEFEVIIVVGPTQDDTLAVCESYAGRIRVLQCPSANLSQSRNMGLLAARGDIVAFIDDDAIPSYRWLEQFLRIFENTQIEATGGAVWAAHPQFSMLQFRLGIFSSLAEQVDVRANWVEQLVPHGYSSYWVTRFMGTNIAIRRKALLEVGGFDEFYTLLADEADLALRLTETGKNLQPVKEAVVYHFPGSSRNRVAFTHKGRWWIRTGARVYLGLKHAKTTGQTLSNTLLRSSRSAGANIPTYWSLLRNQQYNLADFGYMTFQEMVEVCRATWRGALKPRRLIPDEARTQAESMDEPILRFQNQSSSWQPRVDPVSGQEPKSSQLSVSQPQGWVSQPDAPLRICLLSGGYPPQEYGGVARLTHLMAQGLYECGHTVHVVTRAEQEQVTFYDGAFVHKVPLRLDGYQRYQNFFNLYNSLNYSHNVYHKVKRLILNDGIQIVDSPLWQYEGLATLRSGIIPVVVRVVTATRQISDIHNQRAEEAILMGDLERAFLEQADCMLPNTQATLKAVQEVYGVPTPKERYDLIPYGIIPAEDEQIRPFDPKKQPASLTVLYVGRLEKRKGILDLFQAIPKVLRRVPNARFIIAGADNSDHDGFKLEQALDYPAYFAKKYPEYLTKAQFTGHISDEKLQQLYQACDLFVAPSLYESFGLIYLEAMNYAKPVIGCNAGGAPEVIDHGVSGLLSEPQAPGALAEAMISLLLDPEKLRQMGLAGREQILQRFNYIDMARRYASAYRQVIQRWKT
jgi:glycosyltransferase involved in cell wall biosynthesis